MWFTLSNLVVLPISILTHWQSMFPSYRNHQLIYNAYRLPGFSMMGISIVNRLMHHFLEVRIYFFSCRTVAYPDQIRRLFGNWELTINHHIQFEDRKICNWKNIFFIMAETLFQVFVTEFKILQSFHDHYSVCWCMTKFK